MSNKIFVGGISYSITEQELEEVFSQFGEVINVRIVRDYETGKSRGFAFVMFRDAESVEKAITLDNTKIGERIVGVKKAFEKR